MGRCPRLTLNCDLSKAFDVISNDILIKKLNYYGIRGIANTWFVSYLSDRFQCVDIEGHKSSLCPIICGVPQGSILGPLLYLIYVNDISMSTDAKILSFADDTSIILTHFNPATLYTNANKSINDGFEWFCANKLSLNPQKTKYMVLRAPQKFVDFANLSLCIHDNRLTRIGSSQSEQTTTFLGIYIIWMNTLVGNITYQ